MLATRLEILGRTKEAEKLYQSALQAIRKQPRSSQATAGNRKNEVGNELYEKGEYSKALSAYLGAFSDYERALGPDHIHVAAMYDNIAKTLRKQDRQKEADVYARRAEAIRAATKDSQ